RRPRRLRSPRRPLPPRIPPPVRLRTLPRRYHAPRRLAEASPTERRGRPPPRRPRRIARQLPRRRTPLRLPRRQTPRRRPAPDRRFRTHLVPRQCRDPPRSKADRGRPRPILRELPRSLPCHYSRPIAFVPSTHRPPPPSPPGSPRFAPQLAAHRPNHWQTRLLRRLKMMPLISWEDMQEVNVGIVGLGNVGASTLAILSENGDQIALKLGYRLKVVAVCSRSVHTKHI